MQVQRELRALERDFKRIFDQPEPYEPLKLEEYLSDDDVVDVTVFKATPNNMKFARLRSKYPDKTRKELRKIMKLK